MLLAEEDIDRLVNRGFSKRFFVKFSREGYAQLKNSEGHCVFYDVKKRLCNVYVDRPSGCRLYPVMIDENKGIVLDEICLSRNTITEAEKSVKGRRVIRLLERIDGEAARRRS